MVQMNRTPGYSLLSMVSRARKVFLESSALRTYVELTKDEAQKVLDGNTALLNAFLQEDGTLLLDAAQGAMA